MPTVEDYAVPLVVSIIRVTRIGELGTVLTVTIENYFSESTVNECLFLHYAIGRILPWNFIQSAPSYDSMDNG
jgi:hypothetical protein